MALLTPAQVREHYPSLAGTSDDTLVATLCSRVDGLLAAWCGYPRTDAGTRTLEDATYTEHLGRPALDDRVLRLTIAPIVSVTSVHIDAGLEYGAETLVDSSAYQVLESSGELVLPSASTTAWSRVDRANRVVYVAGFVTTPPELVAIAALAVRDLMDRGKTGDQLSGSSSQQSFSRAAATHVLSQAVRAALDSNYTLWGSRVC